jgi:hypothetical protein
MTACGACGGQNITDPLELVTDSCGFLCWYWDSNMASGLGSLTTNTLLWTHNLFFFWGGGWVFFVFFFFCFFFLRQGFSV